MKRIRLQELIFSVSCLSFTWKDCFDWKIIWAFQPCDLPRSPWMINLLFLECRDIFWMPLIMFGSPRVLCQSNLDLGHSVSSTHYFVWTHIFFRSAKLAAISIDCVCYYQTCKLSFAYHACIVCIMFLHNELLKLKLICGFLLCFSKCSCGVMKIYIFFVV